MNRNHFGRQIESFQVDLDLPFLARAEGKDVDKSRQLFKAIFIRAPIVEKLLPRVIGIQIGEAKLEETVVAPPRDVAEASKSTAERAEVEVLAILPGRTAAMTEDKAKEKINAEAGDIVAVRQANVFGTSFHPELTGDPRIHVWWLEEVVKAVDRNHSSDL